jgi:hypothetical protein
MPRRSRLRYRVHTTMNTTIPYWACHVGSRWDAKSAYSTPKPQYNIRAHESLGEADGRAADRRGTLKESIGTWQGPHMRASAIVEADTYIHICLGYHSTRARKERECAHSGEHMAVHGHQTTHEGSQQPISNVAGQLRPRCRFLYT